jgi:Putative peptidoglycan binding domain/OmpA family
MADSLFIIDIGPDGIVASHPRRTELPALVAPLPEEDKAKKFDTLRPHMVAIGCMLLPGHPFAFDSSLVSPEAEARFTKFAEFMLALRKQDNQNPKRFPPCSVFGHTDPTGSEPYNRMLSGRRALAIYALFTRDKKIWDFLFNNPFGGDKWGFRAIQFMLSIPLKDEKKPGTPPSPPFFTGPVDGKKTPETTEAIKAYQRDRNLAVTGFPSEETRQRLFGEYMNAICHDQKGDPFILDAATDFIARNQDKTTHRGDVQGCGEFNPVLLLSAEQEKLFQPEDAHDARDEAYAEDRRVIVYVFKHGTQIDPAKWPCPAALSQATQPCLARFWSDARKVRLKRDPENERRFKETRDTMACRFYHSFAFQSPCEAGVRLWIIRFRIDGFNNKLEPLKFRRYVLRAGSTEFAPVIRGTLSENGELRIPVFDEKALMTVQLDVAGPEFKDDDDPPAPPAAPQPAPATSVDPDSGVDTDKFEGEDKFFTLTLDAGALTNILKDSSDLPTKQRLYNLGFGSNPPAKWKADEFQRAQQQYRSSRGLKAADDIREKLRLEHEGSVPIPEDV